MRKNISITVEDWLEASNLNSGFYLPVTGFMNLSDYQLVLEKGRTASGQVFTVPITLEVSQDIKGIQKEDLLILSCDGYGEVGELLVEEVFSVNFQKDIPLLFGTDSEKHPGVAKEKARSVLRVAGKPKLYRDYYEIAEYPFMKPDVVQKMKSYRGWKTMCGFQTRNPPHLAHEHLQRVALEVVDGLLLSPLIGWKKKGDFTPEAVLEGYQVLVDKFYPSGSVLFGPMRFAMRYAGPREAVFHSIVRKNFGCTHFIVGRDHAGVGGFYDKYAAQNYAKSFDDIGIEILPLRGPYFCEQCNQIVTEKNCRHLDTGRQISGTQMRAILESGTLPDSKDMRPEVARQLISLAAQNRLFIN